MTRHLAWEGCFNARDLGGLRTATGGETCWRRLIRADSLDRLSEAGWQAVREYGVRTVIDLRNEDERSAAPAPPDAIRSIHIPLDVSEARDFWDVWENGPQFATPLYYGPHLERFQERNAAVIADAADGAVVVHCGGGRDRAGQVAMLVLAAVGVTADEVAADYALSAERLPTRYAVLQEPDQGPEIDRFLRDHGTTAEAVITKLLSAIDVPSYLLEAGLSRQQLMKLRRRLLEP